MVQTPLASRDAVQSTKDQVHTIAVSSDFAATWMSFLPRLRRNPSPVFESRCGILLAGARNPLHQTASIWG